MKMLEHFCYTSLIIKHNRLCEVYNIYLNTFLNYNLCRYRDSGLWHLLIRFSEHNNSQIVRRNVEAMYPIIVFKN